MIDRYQQIASSPLGHKLLSTLGLPTPQLLDRQPFSLSALENIPVLVTGCRNTPVLRSLLRTLNQLSAPIQLVESHQSLLKGSQLPAQLRSVEWLRLDRLRDGHTAPLKALVFDATSIEKPDDLHCLYQLFQPLGNALAEQAKLLIVGLQPAHCESAEQTAAQEALEGFIRSLAKEYGPRGATLNLLQLPRSEARISLHSALAYFLSPASVFVSGQSLTLQSGGKASLDNLDEKPLAGKTALITGASRGIGARIAETLSSQGARILALDIPDQKVPLHQLVEKLDGHSLLTDVSSPDAARALVNWLQGNERELDIVVHNAGITRDKTLRKMSPSQWSQVLNINLAAILRIDEQLLQHGLLGKSARVVVMSSVSGIAGNYGQTNYATSKAGLNGYVAHRATELNRGQTINAIAPGFIETDMTASMPVAVREVARRINALSQGGQVEDIAAAASFLVHPGSGCISGQTLRVCGLNPVGR